MDYEDFKLDYESELDLSFFSFQVIFYMYGRVYMYTSSVCKSTKWQIFMHNIYRNFRSLTRG